MISLKIKNKQFLNRQTMKLIIQMESKPYFSKIEKMVDSKETSEEGLSKYTSTNLGFAITGHSNKKKTNNNENISNK